MKKKTFGFQAFMNVINNYHVNQKTDEINHKLGDIINEGIHALQDDSILVLEEINGKQVWRTPARPRVIFTGQKITKWFKPNPKISHLLYENKGVKVYKLAKLRKDKETGAVYERPCGFVFIIKQRCFLVEF